MSQISPIQATYQLSKFADKNSYAQTDTKLNEEKFKGKDSLIISRTALEKADDDAKASQAKNSSTERTGELSEEEKKVVDALKQSDARVRAHEQAHLSAGGGLVRGGASFSYENGPDGRRYAVGGEVQIDISPESEPEATILKMQAVRRAALATSDPSGQDRSVASTASKIEAQARTEAQTKIAEEISPKQEEDSAKKASVYSAQAMQAINAYTKANAYR